MSGIINFLIFSHVYYVCADIADKKLEEDRNCRPRNHLISTDAADVYTLVEASLNSKLILQCHYCNENDDDQPKIWYRFDSLNAKSYEVEIGMQNNRTLNRVQVNLEHSLIIKEIDLKDFGLYYCEGLQEQEAENKYSYLVDEVFAKVILENDVAAVKGNLTDWEIYHEEYFIPVNNLFAISPEPEFQYIRSNLLLKMEVITEWDVWGKCEVCGLPHGRRRQKGQCRLKTTQLHQNATNSTMEFSPQELWFKKMPYFSCRSIHLRHSFPRISNVTATLPYFIKEENCSGICNPDAEGIGRGWKTGKSKGYKYKKSMVLAENTHISFICPESSLENDVVWRKDGRILPPGESVEPSIIGAEPIITVDTFNTLYLYGVTSEESGNYTCQVDNVNMQQIRVFVVSKARLLTQAFLRHMIYLGFILCLTLPCYCAGLVITWTRRDTFMDYKELRKERLKKLRKKGRRLSEKEEEEATSWMYS